MSNIRIGGMLVALMAAQAAGAAGNTPISTPDVAARSALYMLQFWNTLTQQVHAFDIEARQVIERGFGQLKTATTVQALMASPHGVVVACPQGGMLTARMSRGLPRIARFEWSDCRTEDAFGPYTLNGPAEATLLEATFTPSTLYGIRLGDSTRELVLSRPKRPGAIFGESEQHRNLRMTGVIPQRVSELENIPGRFTYELSGFSEVKQMRPDFTGGVPSAELYQYSNTSYADHALVSRERTSGYDDDNVFSFHEDIAFVWGAFGNRVDNPPRPNSPASSRTNEYRGYGLRVQNFIEGPVSGLEIDGKLQVTRSEVFGLGCTAPETFTYRTRRRAVSAPDAPVFNVYSQGEFAVNGATTLQLSLIPAPSGNFFDNRTRLDISSPVLAPASFVVGPAGELELRAAARCTP